MALNESHPGEAREEAPAWGLGLLALWTAATTLLGRAMTLWRPPRYDSALFSYIGSQWVAGRIPYRDVWDNKPPGIFAADALMFRLFGARPAGLALLEACCAAAAVAFVYLFLRRMGSPWAPAALAAAACASAVNRLYFTSGGNLTEIYLVAPAAASMYFFARSAPAFRGGWVFLAGLCAGAASILKPPGLAPLLAQCVFVAVAWAAGRLRPADALASWVLNGLGAAAAWLPAVLYFAAHGALRSMVDASLLYNLRYGMASYGSTFRMLFAPTPHFFAMAPLAASGVIAAALTLVAAARTWRTRGGADARPPSVPAADAWLSAAALAVLWVAFDLAGSLAGGRNYRHYFLPLTVSLSAAAGAVLWRVRSGDDGGRLGARVCGALLVGSLATAQAVEFYQVVRHRGVWARPDALRQVSQRLARSRREGETLFTWNFLPEIFWITGMRSPVYVLDAHYRRDSPASKRLFAETILPEVQRNPPTYVLLGARPSSGDEQGDGPGEQDSNAEFAAWVASRYDEADRAGSLTLYRLRGPG